MAIQFSCACGKAMQAKEEYAGRRVRCGGCGAIVTIPQAGVLTPVAPVLIGSGFAFSLGAYLAGRFRASALRTIRREEQRPHPLLD